MGPKEVTQRIREKSRKEVQLLFDSIDPREMYMVRNVITKTGLVATKKLSGLKAELRARDGDDAVSERTMFTICVVLSNILGSGEMMEMIEDMECEHGMKLGDCMLCSELDISVEVPK